MRVALRWLIRAVSVALTLSLLAVLIAWWMASRSLPDYEADWQVSGISAPVEIVRSNSGIPHIFGEQDADVFFGLGFAHAQDRLWQMLMTRRTAQGRLSELFGPRTLDIDDLLRRLDLYGHASASVSSLSPQARSELDAYARGVNAWIEIVSTEALGRGAPEFMLFSPEIAPWRPADTVAVSAMMALQLAGHHEEEILRARTTLALEDPARLADLMPNAPGDATTALGELAAIFDTVPDIYRAEAQARGHARALGSDPLTPWAMRGRGGASNAWAAMPDRTASDAAILANDPHLGLTAPSIWYLARLELESGGVIGATIPGMPVIMSGRNANVAWGVTSAYLDDIDLYIEELNPQSRNEYRTHEGWDRFETRQEIINVDGDHPITITLRSTRNGPVLPSTLWNLDTVTPPGHVVSMAWTALTDRNTSVQTGLELMRATSASEALAAGRHFVAPAQNLMVADAEGNIALQVIGHSPWRDNDHETLARMPSRGWIPENQWLGVTPYGGNPTIENPETGILGNTNNKTIDRAFPLHVSFEWGDTQRITRLEHLMSAREVHTRESFIEAQLDEVSAGARNVLPLVARDLWFSGDTAPAGSALRRRQDALALLADWNGEMNEHLPEPLIYAAWMRSLQQRLIRDELGPLAQEFQVMEPLFIERVFRDVDGAAIWCDIQVSTIRESCTDIAATSLDEALQWLEDRYGPAIASWRWGEAHEAVHEHPVLGQTTLFSWVVNIRQSSSGGDHTLQRGASPGTLPDPFLNTHSAGYRGVYDFADPDASVFVISTGQSGHPLSPFYDDLGELWRRGEYVPMSLDPTLARAGNIGVTELTQR